MKQPTVPPTGGAPPGSPASAPAATGATGATVATGATGTAGATPSLDQFQIEIDDYYSNYSSWTGTFRGSPQTIKKALRITYRYELTDAKGCPTGISATEHVLVDYAGSDSG